MQEKKNIRKEKTIINVFYMWTVQIADDSKY